MGSARRSSTSPWITLSIRRRHALMTEVRDWLSARNWRRGGMLSCRRRNTGRRSSRCWYDQTSRRHDASIRQHKRPVHHGRAFCVARGRARLVQRDREADLADVRVGIRVLHPVAVPVRSDAGVSGDTYVITHSENRGAARLGVAAEAGNATGYRTDANTAGEEEATVRLGIKAHSRIDLADRQRRALF